MQRVIIFTICTCWSACSTRAFDKLVIFAWKSCYGESISIKILYICTTLFSIFVGIRIIGWAYIWACICVYLKNSCELILFNQSCKLYYYQGKKTIQILTWDILQTSITPISWGIMMLPIKFWACRPQCIIRYKWAHNGLFLTKKIIPFSIVPYSKIVSQLMCQKLKPMKKTKRFMSNLVWNNI